MEKKEMQLARRLRVALAERNWTQRELAEASGVPRPNISNYLAGKSVPTWATLGKLARALGMPTSQLTDGSPTEYIGDSSGVDIPDENQKLFMAQDIFDQNLMSNLKRLRDVRTELPSLMDIVAPKGDLNKYIPMLEEIEPLIEFKKQFRENMELVESFRSANQWRREAAVAILKGDEALVELVKRFSKAEGE